MEYSLRKQQKVESGDIYFGTILEHILLQNLTAFYDVGEHNEMKLHGAELERCHGYGVGQW